MTIKRLLAPVALSFILSGVIITSAFISTPPDTSSCEFSGHKNMKDRGGIANSCGSPGEPGTCSRAGCHASGAVIPGLPDNAGPGSVTITPNPAFIGGNQYIPGQLYNMTVTVSQAGKPRFGFACEILDNSGNTNAHINNTAGTITVTDHINTRTWQPFLTGKIAITQDTLGGFTANSYSFHFDWTAPGAGYAYDSVHIYLCGNAVNNNLMCDSGDYVYSKHIILTKHIAGAGISGIAEGISELNVYPIPTNNKLTVSFNLSETNTLVTQLYSLDGRLVKELSNNTINAGSYSQSYLISDVAKGIYFLKISIGNTTQTRKIIIE